MNLIDLTLGELWEIVFRPYKKDNDCAGYNYVSKEVPGDRYAFDVRAIDPYGKEREFRVLTFGEVKDE